MTEPVDERRHGDRINRHLSFHYRPLGQEHKAWNLVQLKDLSETGVAFVSQEDLALESTYECQLTIPTRSARLHLVGRVKRIHKSSPRFTEYGLMFEEINEVDLISLKSLVQTINEGRNPSV
ncbi:MAG: PilZ domain-containing protein [Candidatus Omnitrophica bacterium]|nr:PilZ domain-containing protein [Candidatus Omnitrophota bacterium]